MIDDILYSPIGDHPIKSKGLINDAIENIITHNELVINDAVVINYTSYDGSISRYTFTLTDIKRP